MDSSTPKPGQRTSSKRPLAILCALLALIAAAPAIKLGLLWQRPPHAERMYQMGVEAFRAGDLGGMHLAAEALAGLDGAEPERRVMEGAIHLRSGRLPQAVDEFQRAREDPHTGALANALAGEALYRNRQFSDAIRALSRATELDPANTDAHRSLAAVLFDIGSTSRAIEELQIVAEQAPDDPRPHRLAALIYKDMEAFESAIAEYRQALRLEAELPDREEVLIEFAQCLERDGRHDELKEVAALLPKTADALTLLARARHADGDSTGAMQLVEQALEQKPDRFESLLLKGSLQLESGEIEPAAKTLQRTAELHPLQFQAHFKLAQVYSRLGESTLADKHQAEAERLRDLRAQFTELHARAAEDQSDAELRHQLGLTASKLGLHELALSWFSAALSLDRNHAGARQAIEAGRQQNAIIDAPAADESPAEE